MEHAQRYGGSLGKERPDVFSVAAARATKTAVRELFASALPALLPRNSSFNEASVALVDVASEIAALIASRGSASFTEAHYGLLRVSNHSTLLRQLAALFDVVR